LLSIGTVEHAIPAKMRSCAIALTAFASVDGGVGVHQVAFLVFVHEAIPVIRAKLTVVAAPIVHSVLVIPAVIAFLARADHAIATHRCGTPILPHAGPAGVDLALP
jgi:hypothetical protein